MFGELNWFELLNQFRLAELNRFDEAYEILKKIAKFNKIKNFKLDKDSSIKLMQAAHKHELLDLQDLKSQLVNNITKTRKKPIHKRIVDFSSILGEDFNYLKLLVLFIVYNVITLIYVGVTVGITSLSDINPYIIFLFSSLFELIGIVICHINNYIGTLFFNLLKFT